MNIDIENTISEINNTLPDIFKVAFTEAEIPKPVINRTGNWVTWGDSSNSYFQTLINSLEQSPIHCSAVRYKASLFASESWKITNENELDQKQIDLVNSFLSNINLKGQTLIDVLQKWSIDLSLTGNAYLLPIWSKDKKRINELYHVDASCIAPEKLNENGDIANYYFSSDWSQYRRKEFTPIAIPTFSNNETGGRQIIATKLNETTGRPYFGEPDFLSALPLIELQADIAAFWGQYIKSNCFANMAITFPAGIPNDDIKRKIEFDFKKIYTGKDRQHIFLNFANNKDAAPIFQTLTSPDLDKAFTVVNGICTESIMSAHRITSPRIFGITTNGSSLGQKDELIEAFQILMNNTIFPVHLKTERIVNNLLSINGFKAKIELVDSTPMNFLFSQEQIDTILSLDEKRQLIGYKPVSTDPNIRPSLVSILGIGGMGSLTSILSSELPAEKQLAILINVFGIEADKAKEIVNGLPVN